MKVSVSRDLGTSVRGRRIDLRMSQQHLAERAGVSRRWLSTLESGKASVELGLVLRVLAALDLELHVAPTPGGEIAEARTAEHIEREAPESANEFDLDSFLERFDQQP